MTRATTGNPVSRPSRGPPDSVKLKAERPSSSYQVRILREAGGERRDVVVAEVGEARGAGHDGERFPGAGRRERHQPVDAGRAPHVALPGRLLLVDERPPVALTVPVEPGGRAVPVELDLPGHGLAAEHLEVRVHEAGPAGQHVVAAHGDVRGAGGERGGAAAEVQSRAQALLQQAGGELGRPQEVLLREGDHGVHGREREEVGEDEGPAALQASAGHERVRVPRRRLQHLLGAEEASLAAAGDEQVGVGPVRLAEEHLLLGLESRRRDRRHAGQRVRAHLDPVLGELHPGEGAEERRSLRVALELDGLRHDRSSRRAPLPVRAQAAR